MKNWFHEIFFQIFTKSMNFPKDYKSLKTLSRKMKNKTYWNRSIGKMTKSWKIAKSDITARSLSMDRTWLPMKMTPRLNLFRNLGRHWFKNHLIKDSKSFGLINVPSIVTYQVSYFSFLFFFFQFFPLIFFRSRYSSPCW